MRRAVVGAALLLGLVLLVAPSAGAHAVADHGTPLVLGGPKVDAIRTDGDVRYHAIDLDLAERVEITIDVPLVAGLTAQVFRPGVLHQGVDDATPRFRLMLARGANARSFTADWPGRWVIAISGDAPAAFTIRATRIAPGTAGAVSGGLTVGTADGLVVGEQLPSSVLDPEQPGRRAARHAWVEAEAGNRVQIAVQPTNGRAVTVEAFAPGTTDDAIEAAAPAAVLTTAGAGTLAFDASIAGAWIVRVTTAGADAATRPATFLWTLASVVPRDPASTCADDVTDIGLVRVTGCLTTGRGRVATDQPVSFSGVDILPVGGATVRIDTETLEVSSTGTFDVNIAGMRILTGTNFFVLRGQWSYEVPGDTVLLGMPITGRIAATWSLEHGGTLAVTGTARLTALKASGNLSFEVSSDHGLRDLRIRLAVEDLQGVAAAGTLSYEQEQAAGELVHVWGGGLSVAVGVAGPTTVEGALPAALVGAAGSLEFRNGRLAYLRVGVNSTIPIGSTGLVVTQLGAALRWEPHLVVAGAGAVALGPEVNGIAALSIRGTAGWSEDGACSGSGVRGPHWFGGGEATIAGWFSILSLDACYQQSSTPFIVVRGRSGFGYEDIVTGSARFDGYILGDQAMMIEGVGSLALWGVAADGRVVISDAGVAACGEANVNVLGLVRRVEIGAERRWADAKGTFAFACPDFAAYRTVPLARASMRASGVAVRVPTGVEQVNLVVGGVGGVVPGVDVVGPDGSVVARSTSTSDPSRTGAIFAPNPETGEMQIALPVGSPGFYRLVPQAGTSISAVKSALPRPEVTVRVRVLRSAGTRTLSYRIAGLDGRRVRFVDSWRGRTRTVGITAVASGALRLSVTARGAHRIRAIVLDEQGLAQPAQNVARYR